MMPLVKGVTTTEEARGNGKAFQWAHEVAAQC